MHSNDEFKEDILYHCMDRSWDRLSVSAHKGIERKSVKHCNTDLKTVVMLPGFLDPDLCQYALPTALSLSKWSKYKKNALKFR